MGVLWVLHGFVVFAWVSHETYKGVQCSPTGLRWNPTDLYISAPMGLPMLAHPSHLGLRSVFHGTPTALPWDSHAPSVGA